MQLQNRVDGRREVAGTRYQTNFPLNHFLGWLAQLVGRELCCGPNFEYIAFRKLLETQGELASDTEFRPAASLPPREQ